MSGEFPRIMRSMFATRFGAVNKICERKEFYSERKQIYILKFLSNRNEPEKTIDVATKLNSLCVATGQHKSVFALVAIALAQVKKKKRSFRLSFA